MLVAKPFGSFGTALSCILFFANLVIFAVAFWRGKYELQQRREVQALQKQTRDLASQLEDFQGRVLGIVAVERSIASKSPPSLFCARTILGCTSSWSNNTSL